MEIAQISINVSPDDSNSSLMLLTSEHESENFAFILIDIHLVIQQVKVTNHFFFLENNEKIMSSQNKRYDSSKMHDGRMGNEASIRRDYTCPFMCYT